MITLPYNYCMTSEKKKLYTACLSQLYFVIIIWLIKIVENYGTSFSNYGIYPRRLFGFVGAYYSRHYYTSGFSHLYANTIPILILSTALFTFINDIAIKIFYH